MYALMDITITNPGVYYALFIFVAAIIMLVAGLAIASWADSDDETGVTPPYIIEAFKGSVEYNVEGGFVFAHDKEPCAVVVGVPVYSLPQPTEESIDNLVPGAALSTRWLSQTSLSGMQIQFIRWVHLSTNKCHYALVRFRGIYFHIRIEDHVEALAFQKWLDLRDRPRHIPMPWEVAR